MKVVFLLAYPIYHDFWTKEQWLNLINQNRWLPGIIADMGYEVEYWAVDHEASVHTSKLEGFGDYTIRIFEAAKKGERTKYHYSESMVNYAAQKRIDLFLIKGIDGGVGTHLIENLLIPENIPYVMVIGGGYDHPLNRHAKYILYESDYQKNKLMNPGIFFWRKAEPPGKLIKLNKSVDVEVFKPFPKMIKKYDIISVGRIVKRNKRFDEIGELSKHYNVAILGDGPYKETLQKKYPQINWLAKVPNSEVPQVLNKAKLYVHPSAKDWTMKRDFFPRTIVESQACGLPSVGFNDAIQKDVIPDDCGIIVSRKEVVSKVGNLLSDDQKLAKMSRNARERAVFSLNKYSAKPALEQLFTKLKPS